MAILEIVRLGHPALRIPAQEVGGAIAQDEELQELIDDLLETMFDAQGVGLAAPQVGVGLQLFVYGLKSANGDGEPLIPDTVLINPMVEPEPGEVIHDWEGCLSIPDLRGLVPRHPAVRVRGLDRQGAPVEFVARGFEARHADEAVQLVGSAICGDPECMFGDTGAVAQCGFAGIAGLCVDFVQHDHGGSASVLA